MPTLLLAEMTWPDVRKAIRQDRVVIIPVGSVEQHGPHLPLDTDIVNSFEVAKRAAKRTGALVAPPLFYGISPHWMGYPGTMSVDYHTFIDFLTQISLSLVKHGFRRIVILNGHGGNQAAIQIAAQNIAESSGVKSVVAAFSYWDISSDALNQLRESTYGGMSHACELETSLQLFLRGNLVKMNRAVKNMQSRTSEFEPIDLADPSKGALIYRVGGGGSSGKPGALGIMGDPTLSSRTKGKRFMDAITKKVEKLLREIAGIRL